MQSDWLEENDLFTHSCSAFLHKATPKGTASVGGITQGITEERPGDRGEAMPPGRCSRTEAKMGWRWAWTHVHRKKQPSQ